MRTQYDTLRSCRGMDRQGCVESTQWSKGITEAWDAARDTRIRAWGVGFWEEEGREGEKKLVIESEGVRACSSLREREGTSGCRLEGVRR